jgi:transitional endoplasmic reticulum ATPase
MSELQPAPAPDNAVSVLSSLSSLLVPALWLLGMYLAGYAGGPQIYARLSTPLYNFVMSSSWPVFVSAGVAAQLLYFQPGLLAWLLGGLKRGAGSTVALERFRLLATLGLWVCALWGGTLLGHAWALLSGMQAFFTCVFALAMAGVAYWATVVFVLTRDAAPAPVPAQTGVDSQAAAGATDAYPKSPQYDFAWEKPASGLDALSGMAELKAELSAALQGFRTYGARGVVHDRNGILLSGPPGNGKTAFALAIAGELGLPFVKLACQDLTSRWINESPAVVKDLFRQAAEQACVVFFDEFDGVAKSRNSANGHNEDHKLVTALLVEIDNARKQHIVLIAATNYVEQLDPALIRDGRFDFRIEIPYPDQQARAAILAALLTKFGIQTEAAVLQYVSELWERRSVAFIEATVKRLRDNGQGVMGGSASVEDFKQASRAACRRASAIPRNGAKLSEIALTSTVRREADSLLYRLRHWENIALRGGEPPSGVLLYGPPGTGKTNFVRALARELEYWHVFEVNAAEVLQDPRKFRDIMELAANHRPAIVFIDEADELLRERTQSFAATATNEILKAMDGMLGKVPEVVFMAATNNPELIDGAALRGGRFAEKIFMGRLTGEDLVSFLEKDFASKTRVAFAADLAPTTLAAKLVEAAPSDALGLLRKAINYTFAQEGGDRPVGMADVDKAIEAMQL